MAHLKANLVLYQSCKYELPNILNGEGALDRIQHGEGGGGGGGGGRWRGGGRWYTQSLWEKRASRVKVE